MDQFAEAGCDCFVFQIEKTDSSTVGELIAKIKDSGMKVNLPHSVTTEQTTVY